MGVIVPISSFTAFIFAGVYALVALVTARTPYFSRAWYGMLFSNLVFNITSRCAKPVRNGVTTQFMC